MHLLQHTEQKSPLSKILFPREVTLNYFLMQTAVNWVPLILTRVKITPISN